MSVQRSRREYLVYKRYLEGVDKNACIFCDVIKEGKQVSEKTKHFNIIRNIFPYSIWDAQTVDDHLMIVPTKHSDNLSSTTSAEKVEYVDLVSKYEKRGYNIYARAPQSKIKSIPHQHTHLIKTKGDHKKMFFLIYKPYLRIVR